MVSTTVPYPSPLYSPSDNDSSDTIAELKRQMTTTTTTILPSPFSPGFATESLLTRGLQVPSKADYFTSGFAYPSILSNYDISPHHWDQFTRELKDEAKLSSRQWTTAIGKGLGTLAIGGMMMGVLGAVPAVIVARKARRNREEQNLIIAASERTQVDGEEETESGSRLSRKIQLWNDTFFGPRGVLIRVDLPWEGLEDMQTMDVSTSREFQRERTTRWSRSSSEMRIQDDQAAREDASRKARIVIIPLEVSE